MKRFLVGAAILGVASTLQAQVPVEKVRLDTQVIERIIEVSQQANKRSFPDDIARRITQQMIENLRGPKNDGTYAYAYYDRFEAGRHAESCSVQVQREGEHNTCESTGSNIYRVLVEVPARRLLVARNRKLWIEKIEFDYIPQGSSDRKQSSVDVKGWFDPGSSRGFDLPEIARTVTAKVHARGDAETGYGNILVTVLEARVIDDARSPYANAVARAKNLLKTIEREEPEEVRAGAASIREALPAAAASALQAGSAPPELYMELQDIEDLLMGTEQEKQQGLEQLRQLRRKVRPR